MYVFVGCPHVVTYIFRCMYEYTHAQAETHRHTFVEAVEAKIGRISLLMYLQSNF